MEKNIKNIIKNMSQQKNSSTILISHKKIEKQLKFVEEFARTMLKLNKEKSYRTHPDILGIWPDNINGRTIKIEQIHNFIRKIQLKPYLAKLKIGVIISADKTTKEAQNALLKTLEEPPQNTYIILTTSNTNKLLPTIISRCQVLELRDTENNEINEDMVNTILKSNIIERFQTIEKLIKQKDKSELNQDINNLIENLLIYFRRQLLKKNKKANTILTIINLIETTQIAIEKNVNTRLALENLMINLPLKGVDY